MALRVSFVLVYDYKIDLIKTILCYSNFTSKLITSQQ